MLNFTCFDSAYYAKLADDKFFATYDDDQYINVQISRASLEIGADTRNNNCFSSRSLAR